MPTKLMSAGLLVVALFATQAAFAGGYSPESFKA